ncbi:hypothetical protein D3C81_1666770 [compost metagenome]
MPFPGRVGLFVQRVQRSTGPQAVRVLDEKRALGQVQGHGVGGVGLQLQRMGTGLGRGLDDLQRHVQGLVMVAAHLGNDERRRIGTDQALANLEASHLRDPSIRA